MARRRIVALYDIHGNLDALEAVLEPVTADPPDLLVCGGDVAHGPMARACLERLLDVDVPVRFVMGNCDREVAACARGVETPWYARAPEAFRTPVRWAAEQLDAAQVDRIESWPVSCEEEVVGLGRVLFCHASPRNDMDVFTAETPAHQLAPLFDEVSAPLVVCGHTHMPYDRTIGVTRVVNPGSVGMPFGPPGAYWLSMGPDVRLERSSYDLDRAASRVRESAYPDADTFVAKLRRPPGVGEMVERFRAMEFGRES